jgi:hypothetical protein
VEITSDFTVTRISLVRRLAPLPPPPPPAAAVALNPDCHGWLMPATCERYLGTIHHCCHRRHLGTWGTGRHLRALL